MNKSLKNGTSVKNTSNVLLDLNFEDLIINSPLILFFINSLGLIDQVSAGWLDTFGYDREDVIGKPLTGFLSKPKEVLHLETVLELQMDTKKGIPLDLEVHTQPLFGPTLRDTGYIVHLVDITEKKKLATQLKDAELLFNLIQQSSLDGFWDWNIETNEEYLSPRFKEMFGYLDHEMENSIEAWQKIIFTDDLEKSFIAFDEHVNQGKPYCVTLRYRHKNGSTVHVLCRGSVVRDKTGKPVRMIGSHTDITDLKNTEHQLERAKEDLINFQRLASHDFQEPIKTQLLFIDMLTQNLIHLGHTNVLRDLNKIKDAALDVQRLSNNINHYLRLNAAPEMTQISLQDCIQDAKNNLHALFEKQEGHLVLNPLPTLVANPEQLTLLFECLFENALKFRSSEKPEIHIQAKVIDKRRLLIQVKDNGKGIDKKDLEKIFLPMKRLYKDDETMGAGMGLAMAKKIVEIHGGEIVANSEIDKGTTIFITLLRGENHDIARTS